MKKILLILVLALSTLSCRKAFDTTPKVDFVINGFQQSSYEVYGFFDGDNVFHNVTYPPQAGDSSDYNGHKYPIVTTYEFGIVDVKYEARNVSVFAADYEVEFEVLLTDGSKIYKIDEGYGLEGKKTASGEVFIETNNIRALEVKVSNYSVE